MPQMLDEAGNVWEVDAQGNQTFVRSAGQAQGRVFTLPMSPEKKASEARAVEDQAMQRDAAERAERAAIRADKTAQRQADAAGRSADATAAVYLQGPTPRRRSCCRPRSLPPLAWFPPNAFRRRSE